MPGDIVYVRLEPQRQQPQPKQQLQKQPQRQQPQQPQQQPQQPQQPSKARRVNEEVLEAAALEGEAALGETEFAGQLLAVDGGQVRVSSYTPSKPSRFRHHPLGFLVSWAVEYYPHIHLHTPHPLVWLS